MAERIIVANWKMNVGYAKTVALARAYRGLKRYGATVVVAPTFPALPAVSQVLKNRSGFLLGAQDCGGTTVGAYTGEVSAPVLREVGCRAVILGHSERRQYCGETPDDTRQEVQAALDARLIPIVCLGETWDEHRQHRTHQALERQCAAVFRGITLRPTQRIWVVYEPTWTISTSGGRIASAAEVGESLAALSQSLVNLYGAARVVRQFRFLYGGTINPRTIQSFATVDRLSGFLVGSAALSVDTFQDILDQWLS